MGPVARNLLAASFVTRTIESVPPATAYLLIFLLPALEASIFLGFVIPGETAVVLGGVLAYHHSISLPAAIACAVAGAIIGDSIGFEIGHRWGAAARRTRLGQIVSDSRWAKADAFLNRRRGSAIFLGRFTAVLRALMPAAAGMAHIPYRSFLPWNIAGGLCWATSFTLLGYFAGSAYQRVETISSRLSLALLAILVIGVAVRHLVRSRSERTT